MANFGEASIVLSESCTVQNKIVPQLFGNVKQVFAGNADMPNEHWGGVVVDFALASQAQPSGCARSLAIGHLSITHVVHKYFRWRFQNFSIVLGDTPTIDCLSLLLFD